jgi:acyl-homoserine lactone synthase
MIHIVTSENRRLYGLQLEVLRAPGDETNGGTDLLAGAGGEIDVGAVHLVALDDDMRLEIGLSLRPTDRRCGLADTFPHLIAPGEPPKKGFGVWEATRLLTTGVHGARTDRGARMGEVWAAAMELALANRVERIVGMIDMRLYPQIADGPLGVRLTGLPRAHCDGVIAGLEIVVTRALLDGAYEAIGVEGPVGYHVDALDLRAFGDLAAVQRQMVRAQIPQFDPGSARDETLSAEVLYEINDRSIGAQSLANRAAHQPVARLNA